MYERIRDGRQIQAFDFHKSLSPPQIQLLFGVRNCLCPAQCQGRIRKKNPPIGQIHLGGHRPSRSTDISRPKKKILETSENRKDIFPLERRDFLFSLSRPFDIVDRIHQFQCPLSSTYDGDRDFLRVYVLYTSFMARSARTTLHCIILYKYYKYLRFSSRRKRSRFLDRKK